MNLFPYITVQIFQDIVENCERPSLNSHSTECDRNIQILIFLTSDLTLSKRKLNRNFIDISLWIPFSMGTLLLYSGSGSADPVMNKPDPGDPKRPDPYTLPTINLILPCKYLSISSPVRLSSPTCSVVDPFPFLPDPDPLIQS